jgi:hypothetical protein
MIIEFQYLLGFNAGKINDQKIIFVVMAELILADLKEEHFKLK